MGEFANPGFLLLVPLVPLLVWRWLRRPRPALRFPDVGRLAGLPAGRGPLARRAGAALRGLALLLLVVALAGPRWPDRGSRIVTEGIAVMMLVDVSGSMAEADFDWQGEPVSRLEAVKRAFRLFVAGGAGPDGEPLPGRPEDQIGLVTFATRPESACPLTLSHGVLLRLLDAEEPRRVPTEGHTNIGDAIVWGLVRLESAGPRRQVLILLSDGEHNVPPPAFKPRQAAQLAARRGVPIYVIDAGPPSAPAPLPPGERGEASPPAGEGAGAAEDRARVRNVLQAVAEISGGRYFAAHDTAGLLRVCQEIDRLEQRPIESFLYRRYYEGYPWVGLGALVLMVAVVGLELTAWRRVP